MAKSLALSGKWPKHYRTELKQYWFYLVVPLVLTIMCKTTISAH